MKKPLVFVLALLIAAALCACEANVTDRAPAATQTPVATEAPDTAPEAPAATEEPLPTATASAGA